MCIMSTNDIGARRVVSPTILLTALLSLLSGCELFSNPPRPAKPDAAPHQEAEVLDKTFEELYPIFLYRKSMSQGQKATLWRDYRGRWVRWEGVVASVTDHGMTFKHLLTTTTFDVSLTCDRAALASAKARFGVGDRVRYVGRLESFDDIFRTLYVSNGVVIEKTARGDLGVPADLARVAP